MNDNKYNSHYYRPKGQRHSARLNHYCAGLLTLLWNNSLCQSDVLLLSRTNTSTLGRALTEKKICEMCTL